MQYYEENGQVKQHLFCKEITFQDAYNEMLNMYKIFNESMVIVCGLSREDINYIVLNQLKNGKSLMTVIST
jgi:hypothetical protein